VPSGVGRDFQVGPSAGQLSSLDQVPWETLGAGDTVRIFHRPTPYSGKFVITANGTAAAPVRVCGVRSSAGERPIVTGANAVTRKTLVYGGTSSAAIQESRSVIMIKANQVSWTHYPTHVQIDGLAIRSAHPNYKYTDTNGAIKTYTDFGACIWIDRGQNVTLADNEISDCTNGIFSKSTEDGDFAVTKNVRIAGNYIHGNGIVGAELMHNSYMQASGIVYEFNHYGALRSGARGNAIKDRSVGTIVRYNRIEGGARAMDLVEAEDFATAARADPAYRTTYVYGNKISKSGDTGSFIHYGGDHIGSEYNNRKGTLYFFNNTIYATGSGAAYLFQLSTTEERAEVWNNVFYFAPSVTYPSLRTSQEVSAGLTSGGIVNLGINWVNTATADSDPYHPVAGQLIGLANQIRGTAAPIDVTTLLPLAGSPVLNVAQPQLSAVSAHPVNFQLDTAQRPVGRTVVGTGMDLGAMERP
jgi:hypothetical protein